MLKLNHLTKFISVFFVINLLVGCSDNTFTGSSNQKPRSPSSNSDQKPKGGKSNKAKGSKDDADTNSNGDGNGDADSDTQNNGASNSEPGSDDIVTIPTDDGQLQQTFRGNAISGLQPVDIIFAMDTSGSMDQEKSALQSNMAQFINQFQRTAASLDYQIFMIGDDFNFPAAGGRINLVQQEVDSNNALAILVDFFQGSLGGSSAVRPNTIKQIVVITDDDAEDVTADGFKSFIQSNPQLNGRTRFNGFVGLPSSQENGQCELASIGNEYIKLGADPSLQGLIQDLCVQNWGQLLTTLASNIISQAQSGGSFVLDYPADTSKKITIQVDGMEVGADVATYNPNSQSIVFASGSEPQSGSELVVTYTPIKS